MGRAPARPGSGAGSVCPGTEPQSSRAAWSPCPRPPLLLQPSQQALLTPGRAGVVTPPASQTPAASSPLPHALRAFRRSRLLVEPEVRGRGGGVSPHVHTWACLCAHVRESRQAVLRRMPVGGGRGQRGGEGVNPRASRAQPSLPLMQTRPPPTIAAVFGRAGAHLGCRPQTGSARLRALPHLLSPLDTSWGSRVPREILHFPPNRPEACPSDGAPARRAVTVAPRREPGSGHLPGTAGRSRGVRRNPPRGHLQARAGVQHATDWSPLNPHPGLLNGGKLRHGRLRSLPRFSAGRGGN